MSTELATTQDDLGSALEQFRAAMGSDIAIPGLESVRPEDLALPIISIDHKENVFVDKLTGEKYEAIDGVLLGLFKQRVLWDADTGDKGKGLLCKSRDANTGEPKQDFPWDAYKAKGGTASVGSSAVSCEECPLAQWGSHPRNDTPWCSLQHVYPLIIGDGEEVTGLLTLQRSGIKPSNAYLTGFVRDGKPLFTAKTHIVLNSNRQGSVDYSVPKFTRMGTSTVDVELWQRWAAAFDRIKKTVQGSGVVGSDSKAAVVKPTAEVVDATPETPAAKF